VSNFREQLRGLLPALDIHEAQQLDYIARLERKVERLEAERNELEKVLRDHDILRDGRLREL
jgi:hypothetical protein